MALDRLLSGLRSGVEAAGYIVNVLGDLAELSPIFLRQSLGYAKRGPGGLGESPVTSGDAMQRAPIKRGSCPVASHAEPCGHRC